ncbi:esterase/lipase family protein, partial [Candidatus Margulisiibacteriota bacterium]
MMKFVKIISLCLFAVIIISSVAYAISYNDIEYAKNYLIILVHGIGDDKDCFNNVKAYLENNGLSNYVYAYQFSDKFLRIENEGHEFGNRNYYNPAPGMGGKCWLEKAKEEFSRKKPGFNTPNKFIVIAHSMGGLAVRSYIYGKGELGERLYRNDIEKVLFIDTPHKGSGAATYIKNTQELFPHFASVSAGSLSLTFFYTLAGNDNLSRFYATLFGYTFVSQTINSSFRSALNRYKTPALLDMIPNSDFLRSLNQYKLGNFDPIKYRVLGTAGIPTPLNIDKVGTFSLGINPIALMMASTGNILSNPKLDTFEGRFTGAYFTMASGYPIFENGDLTIDIDSQMGYGIKELSEAKRFIYKFRCPSIALLENSLFSGLDYVFDFLPPPAKAAAYIALGLSVVNYVAVEDNADSIEYVMGHITSKDKVVLGGNPNLLDQMLFEESQPAGSTTAQAVQQIPLVLSSNQTIEAGKVKTLSSYHIVSSEAMAEAPTSYLLGTPIVVEGKEKKIESFTVKEPPTRIEGVLRDFMPLKMQYFQYSENFAVWKDIKILNEWGHFRIDNLKLAEGQNIIAFRAK